MLTLTFEQFQKEVCRVYPKAVKRSFWKDEAEYICNTGTFKVKYIEQSWCVTNENTVNGVGTSLDLAAEDYEKELALDELRIEKLIEAEIENNEW